MLQRDCAVCRAVLSIVEPVAAEREDQMGGAAARAMDDNNTPFLEAAKDEVIPQSPRDTHLPGLTIKVDRDHIPARHKQLQDDFIVFNRSAVVWRTCSALMTLNDASTMPCSSRVCMRS